MSLSIIRFKSETFETNLFIKYTSVMKMKKDYTISIFNFIHIFHLDF
jgi:hypothetical protein